MNRTSSQQVNHTANRRRANEANGSANRSLLLMSLVLSAAPDVAKAIGVLSTGSCSQTVRQCRHRARLSTVMHTVRR